MMILKGEGVQLRAATLNDRETIYRWMAHSDITPLMMGPPHFSDCPIPTWEEFLEDYVEWFFDGSNPHGGRCFIIESNGKEVGQINFESVGQEPGVAEMDIWLAGAQFLGKGYGSAAIKMLSTYLFEELHIQKIIIAPSARNQQAIAAYQKAGFVISSTKTQYPDYEDTVTLELIR